MLGRRRFSSFANANTVFPISLILCIFFLKYFINNYHDYERVKEEILEETRSELRVQLKKYDFSISGVEDLDDLILERGGQPSRIMIVSSWRSGSSFLGDIFNAMPGNFYHYEPMYNYSIVQIKGPPLAENALRIIKSLYMCSYQNMEHHFETCRSLIDDKRKNLFQNNTRLWKQCKKNLQLCFDVNFNERFCKLFPFQSMKLVRFRLRLVREIMQNKIVCFRIVIVLKCPNYWNIIVSRKHITTIFFEYCLYCFNVKTILLVRDPRAVMQSRRHSERDFCLRGADCFLPEYLCADMISDYTAAGLLMQEFPDRFMVLRFEELALNVFDMTEKLYKFTGRQMLPAVEEFLRTHTNRDKQVIPFKWKHLLEFKYVKEVQVLCKQAMDLWGYEMAYNETHMKSKQFCPLREYSLL